MEALLVLLLTLHGGRCGGTPRGAELGRISEQLGDLFALYFNDRGADGFDSVRARLVSKQLGCIAGQVLAAPALESVAAAFVVC